MSFDSDQRGENYIPTSELPLYVEPEPTDTAPSPGREIGLYSALGLIGAGVSGIGFASAQNSLEAGDSKKAIIFGVIGITNYVTSTFSATHAITRAYERVTSHSQPSSSSE